MSYEKYSAEIQKAYFEIKEAKGRTPSSRDIPHLSAILSKYHTWNQFVAVMENKSYYDKVGTISDEKLLVEIRKLYHELGYPPRPAHYKRYRTATLRFGTWDNALKQANVPHTMVKNSYYTYEELEYKAQQIKQSGEENYSWQHLRKQYHYPVSVAVKAYGSFDKFRQQFSMEKRIFHLSRMSVVAAYMTLKRQHGKVTVKMLSNYFGCSSNVMERIILEVNNGKGFMDIKKQLD